jgi:hypothetical protein
MDRTTSSLGRVWADIASVTKEKMSFLVKLKSLRRRLHTVGRLRSLAAVLCNPATVFGQRVRPSGWHRLDEGATECPSASCGKTARESLAKPAIHGRIREFRRTEFALTPHRKCLILFGLRYFAPFGQTDGEWAYEGALGEDRMRSASEHRQPRCLLFVARAVGFVQAASRSRGNSAAAFAALYPDFGNSYFFCVFGHNDQQSVPAGQSR